MVVYLRKSIHSLLSVFKKKAGPKGNEDQKRLTVHYTVSPHYQENVFIEGSRPQYLEDLHTEAQEGLKIQQQEENKNGVNFPDDESIASTDTLRPEQDTSSKDGGGSPDSISTTGNTDTTVTYAVSTRPVLTRQGSTFKPLNPVKRLDKSKKRSRRTTIMGIPNQVQKEIALHRSSTFQPLVSTQLSEKDSPVSDTQSGVVIIPTVDGGNPMAKKEGARVHLSDLEQTSHDDQLVRKHLQTMYQDELSFNHQGFGSYRCPSSNLRPKSLAVPGMTTSSSISPLMFNFLQDSQGPVMSISPQATYMSTIIPNAILPASVEVIEIDRSNSQTRGSSINHGSSVRTVSKSSLTSGDLSVSPLLSRRSDGDGSQNDSTQVPVSTSGSNWSESQSSRTLILNPSPVSSKSSTASGNLHQISVCAPEVPEEQTHGEQDHISLSSSVSAVSSPSGKGGNAATEPECGAEEHPKNKRNCSRSLSVMKTKQPPAPPRRTNSLHGSKINGKIRGSSRVQVDILNDSTAGELRTDTEGITKDNSKMVSTKNSKVLTPSSNSIGSPDSSSCPLSPTQASFKESGGATDQPTECSNSPRKTPSEGEKFERTMSPSSGYSSQSGTPTHSPKEISPSSPDKQKKTPVKPERSVSRASSAASPSSSLTSLSSGTSELANPDISTCSQNPPSTSTATDPTSSNAPLSLTMEIRELLKIPAPPKVKAPCPPPPETWAYNRRTLELLCGPSSSLIKVNEKPAPENITDKRKETQKETRTEVSGEKQTTPEESVLEQTEGIATPESLSTMLCKHDNEQEGDKTISISESPSSENKVEASVALNNEEGNCHPVDKGSESQVTTPKREPPPVMKKPTILLHQQGTVLTEQFSEAQQSNMSSSAPPEIQVTVEDHMTSQNNAPVITDENGNETKIEAPSMQTLAVEHPKTAKVSPPPTPPPAYHPTPPLSRKTPLSSVTLPQNELQKVQEESTVGESSWPPPPPPPLEGETVFDGADEVDFPPPPPPYSADNESEVIDRSVAEVDTLDESTSQHSDLHVEDFEAAPALNEPLDVQVSNTDTGGEALSRETEKNVLPISDIISPPSVESLTTPPITRPQSPISITELVPPITFVKRSSLKIEDQSSPSLPNHVQPPPPPTVPVAPPLPAENLTHAVSFRRQPGATHKDARSKELLSRHKSAPIPKEDANIPLVTPSLLQMVRLRSVNMTEDQVNTPSEDIKPSNDEGAVQDSCLMSVQGSQNTPQKPIRKSLSLKSPPPHIKTPSMIMSTPSMRLQEAIRMKTAAMSSRDGLPCRLGVRSPPYGCTGEPGTLSLKSPEGYNPHKSPASAASFIFSRSTKKVVVETVAASSPEAQAAIRQSLASEILLLSDQSRAASFSNGGVKCDKIPPPVAKKPATGSVSPTHNPPRSSMAMALNAEGNGGTGGVQHTGGITLPETTTRVTADTIETLF